MDLTLDIPAKDSISLVLDYSSDVSVYKFDERYPKCFFSYLVGSARAWNHSLDHVYFEFGVPESLYDGTGSYSDPEWEESRKLGYRIFKQEYEDWTPIKDAIQLSWETDDRLMKEVLMSQPYIWVIQAGMTAVMVVIIIIVMVIWNKVKKKP